MGKNRRKGNNKARVEMMNVRMKERSNYLSEKQWIMKTE
jgi:hypothetical protein